MATNGQGGGGSGAGYAAMIPQLVGAGLQIAAARPTRQERQQRRIAMGAPDPAVEALRRRLATQQLQNAAALAAAAPGINPALAMRQAQAGLAQSEIGTAAQLASQQAESVRQARASDPLARRRDAALSGVGGMLNILGTGLATQAAGRQLAEQDAEAAQKAAMAMQAPQPPVAETGMAAPGGVQVTPEAGTETTVALPPTVETTVEPSAAPTEVQAAAPAPSATGVENLGAVERRGAPGPVAEGAAPTERTIVAPGPSEPGYSETAFDQGAMVFTPEEVAAAEEQALADQVAAQMSAGMGQVRTPRITTPTGGFPEPSGLPQADLDQITQQDLMRQREPGRPGGELGLERRPVRQIESPAQVRERRIEEVRATLPRAVADDARNQALIESLADAEDMGDPELVQMIRALIAAEGVL